MDWVISISLMWLWEPTNLFKCKGALTIVITYANDSSSVTRGTFQFFLAKTVTSTVADLYPHSFVGASSPGALSRYHQGMVMLHGQVARRRFQSRRHFATQAGLCQFENADHFWVYWRDGYARDRSKLIEAGSLHRLLLDFLQVRMCSIHCPALAYRLRDIPTGCNQVDANTQSIDTTQGAMQFMRRVQVWPTVYNHGCPGWSRGSLKITFNFKVSKTSKG